MRLLFRAVLLFAIPAALACAQGALPPPDYSGVRERVPGVFVTPLPGAPCTATVEITSRQELPGGAERVLTTVEHIARDGSGRIYNEARAKAPAHGEGRSKASFRARL